MKLIGTEGLTNEQVQEEIRNAAASFSISDQVPIPHAPG